MSVHEIDLYVTVNFGSGYESVFIFECKKLGGTGG